MNDIPPTDTKLTAAKERWARERRGQSAADGASADRAGRLPPGQHVVKGLPQLDLGTQPDIALSEWRFGVSGRVETPLSWDWDAFMAQPQVEIRVDIHCVTTWSSYDHSFVGVSARHVLEAAGVRPDVGFLMARGFDGYSTNLPLADFAADDVLLCHTWNGAPLSRAHGGPMRLVVPQLYFWKSAKWLRHITFLEHDQPGYWEVRGYHSHGDPWREERYDD